MQFRDEQNWHRLDSLLDELLALDGPAREQRLEAIAHDAPALLKPLKRLLASSGHGHTLDEVLGEALAFLSKRDARPKQQRLGPWRLLSELGRGGMAQVFLAERADGAWEQKAAVKLLWPGMAGSDVLARFEQERQILAAMDDARIARLIDGGLTEDGRPWLAMEYVEGRPVDQFCDQQQLGIEGRLTLFCEIAAAVGAAHRRLIVHRDIKPANVLITEKGQVKLLDFGIAKLLDEDAMPHAAPATRRAERLLTPEYASPEQLTESPITTASDVYQLGALLFQLLTGEPPHRRRGLSTAEFEQQVLAADPSRPSVRVRALEGDTADQHARARGLARKGLIHRLRGDLDAIVMKALRNEPQRRYGSVAELVDDVNGYLSGLPVRARPETLRYQAGKFVRRHLAGVTAGAVFALLLIAYAITITGQARQLAYQRDQVRIEAVKAERVRDFLLGLFAAADPYGDNRTEVTAGQLVDAGVEQIRGDLDEEPEIRAEMLGTLGDVLMGLAAHDRAEDLVGEALALQRRLHSRDHPDLARAIARYGTLRNGMGDPEAAERHAREALAMRRRLYGQEHASVAESLGQVAVALTFQARYGEAERVYRQALALRRRLDLPLDGAAAVLWNDLGVTLDYAERRGEAETAHREALAIRRRLFAPDHPAVAESLNNLALTLSNQGRLTDAEPLYRETVEIRRHAFGSEHPQVAVALHNLGLLLRRAGKLDEAAVIHGEAMDIRRSFFGDVHSNVAMSLHALADVARDRGVADDAEHLYREALSMFRATAPEGHPRIGWAAVGLGRNLLQQGRIQEADALLDEGVTTLQLALGEESGLTGQARLALGLCRAAQGLTTEARSLIESGLPGAQHSATADPNLITEATDMLTTL